MKKSEILTLVEKVHQLKKDKSNTLPENSFFLDEDEIVCFSRSGGDSRYPYYNDGLVIFAHSNGYIDCNESDFDIFSAANSFVDANIAFFAGEKKGEYFTPVSITGAARQLFEDGIQRYTVFTPACAYYITETADAIFAVRMHVDDNKHLRFSVCAINLGEKRDLYLCAYFEPTLKHDLLYKYSERVSNGGYVVTTTTEGIDCLAIRTKVEGEVSKRYFTTARNTIVGGKGRNLTNAEAFKQGCFSREVPKMNMVDAPVACDMIHFDLDNDGFAQMSYEMILLHDKEEAKKSAALDIDVENEEKRLVEKNRQKKEMLDHTIINLGNWHNAKVHPDVLNKFLRCVRRQVSFCALGKNYASPYLGIRDVFQQLELSLIWQKKESRAQIVRVMNYILEDGRPPRQTAIPMHEGDIPTMDLRPYIDQGLWIVSTLHTYLSFTDDYSILDEECGYYKAEGTYGPLSFSADRDSVLAHLLRTMRFLISNIDEETGCLRALYGDWNDAVDGLGKTKDPEKEFGNGVSVMATLQLYLAFELMCEMLVKIGGYGDVISQYRALQEKVAQGIEKYAIVKNEDGFARMSHGWGEDRSFYIGSFKDHDGESRISLTSNAFYAISGIFDRLPEYKEDIVKNIMSLDSRFGLLTFSKAFLPDSPEVGRICRLTPGTYENLCTYVHAGMFGISALFMLGHPKDAWNELEKAMVISHDKVTMTTFVMPNSYCIDGAYDYDGESMGDWHTGSGAVLIKNFIKYGFGIEPSMDSVKIIPASYLPTDTASITLSIADKEITMNYENRGIGERQMYFNGEKLELDFDSTRNTPYAVLPKSALKDKNQILVLD